MPIPLRPRYPVTCSPSSARGTSSLPSSSTILAEMPGSGFVADPGFSACHAPQWRDHDRDGLGLPPRVDDRHGLVALCAGHSINVSVEDASSPASSRGGTSVVIRTLFRDARTPMLARTSTEHRMLGRRRRTHHRLTLQVTRRVRWSINNHVDKMLALQRE
jgi:hypothetical protein